MTRRLIMPSKSGKSRRGFTLVEMVIVGALIALFSSLAIFGVQQQFRSNTRKAVIGETRQIATALEFANLDTGIFPKLCWLTESAESLEFIASQLYPPGATLTIYGTMDIAGRTSTGTFASRVRDSWNGPYFAMSQTRAGVAQGRGGFVYMLFDDISSNSGPNNVANPGGIRWPADTYNNPYVVYMLDVDASTRRLSFVSQETNVFQPTRKGNFVNAVVSYGPNQFPGGDEFERPDFGAPPAGDAAVTAAGNGVWNMRLYRGFPGYVPDAKGRITFTMRPRAELNQARANVWSADFAALTGSPLAPSGIGITDIGSDDIVFEF